MCRAGGRRCDGANRELANARRRAARNRARAEQLRVTGDVEGAAAAEQRAEWAEAEQADLANMSTRDPDDHVLVDGVLVDRDVWERHQAEQARIEAEQARAAADAKGKAAREERLRKEEAKVARLMAKRQADQDAKAAEEKAARRKKEAAELAKYRKQAHYVAGQPGVVMTKVRGGYKAVPMTPEQYVDAKWFEARYGRPPVAPHEVFQARQEEARQRQESRAAAIARGELDRWKKADRERTAAEAQERKKLAARAKVELAKVERKLAREARKAERAAARRKRNHKL